jgi:hypothetical protein
MNREMSDRPNRIRKLKCIDSSQYLGGIDPNCGRVIENKPDVVFTLKRRSKDEYCSRLESNSGSDNGIDKILHVRMVQAIIIIIP